LPFGLRNALILPIIKSGEELQSFTDYVKVAMSSQFHNIVEKLMSKKNSHTGHRDSKSGQFVTEKYAKKHPRTTQKESIPNPGKGDTGGSKKK
jgi:hypothetical protein